MSETVLLLQRVGVSGDAKRRVLAFGVFELDVSTDELRKEGRLIHLRQQPVRVLRLLLERAGELVTRREITNALWPDDIDVDVEQGLNHCMRELRAAIGCRPESPRFIQTLPRRGYRFLGEVFSERSAQAAESKTQAPASVEGPRHVPVDPEADQWLGDGRFE